MEIPAVELEVQAPSAQDANEVPREEDEKRLFSRKWLPFWLWAFFAYLLQELQNVNESLRQGKPHCV